MTRRLQPIRSDERGLSSLEFSFLAVVLLATLLLIAGAWQLTQASHDVRDAAAEAARAASLTSQFNADAEARHAATESLKHDGVTCSNLTVRTTSSATHVTVVVTCGLDLSAVAGSGLPGSATVTSTASEVIDVHRGDA